MEVMQLKAQTNSIAKWNECMNADNELASYLQVLQVIQAMRVTCRLSLHLNSIGILIEVTVNTSLKQIKQRVSK